MESMDLDYFETKLATLYVVFRNMQVRFIAYRNPVEETTFKFYGIEHYHFPGDPSDHLPHEQNMINFYYRPQDFLDLSYLERAVIAMLGRPDWFRDHAILDVVRGPLFDFCSKIVKDSNGHGIRFQIRTDLHYHQARVQNTDVISTDDDEQEEFMTDDEDGEEEEFMTDDDDEETEEGSDGVAESDSAIAKLEKVKDLGAEGLNFRQDECVICTEEFEKNEDDSLDLARMPCKHVFHYQCIARWLKRSQACPLCRHEMYG